MFNRHLHDVCTNAGWINKCAQNQSFSLEQSTDQELFDFLFPLASTFPPINRALTLLCQQQPITFFQGNSMPICQRDNQSYNPVSISKAQKAQKQALPRVFIIG